MIIHKDSHTDHAITQAQWQHILAVFEGRTGSFIETIELPSGLGHAMNGLYGPSCGDAPIPENEVYYARRPPRVWNSRMVRMPTRPARFVRVIAGPHETPCAACGGEGRSCLPCEGWGTIKYPCVLYTAYGVSGKDMPQAPREPGDLEAQLKRDIAAVAQVQLMRLGVPVGELAARDAAVSECIVRRDKTVKTLLASRTFWTEHALAAEAC